ncbi:MAG: hypothetical protein AB1609_22255, partial [Bacillota bacterium]
LYGQGYRDLRASLTLVVVATFFNAVLSIPGQVLAATNRMWLGFALNLVWASVFLIGSRLAVAQFGAVGASAAYLLSYLVHALTSTLGAVVLLRLPAKAMLPVLGSSAVALGTLAWWAVGAGGVGFLAVGGAATGYTVINIWRSVSGSLAQRISAAIRTKGATIG